MFFAFVLLATALSISGVAAYYSIVGLTAIFAAAWLPIIIMGSVLEVGKIVTTVWLHKYWKKIPFLSKLYLMIAVLVLMFITSMGIFGFLSKAHIEQTATAGDNTLQIELIDNQINRAKRRIVDAENVITQLDAQVAVLVEYKRIRGATGSVATRKSQKPERDALRAAITESSDAIGVLQDKRLVLSKEQLSIEAEVGPIKYIAEFVYGDTADRSMLEDAVRWVIIIIVIVFDPLAIMLILSASMTFKWEAENRREQLTHESNKPEPNPSLLLKLNKRLKQLSMDINDYEVLIAQLDTELATLSTTEHSAESLQLKNAELERDKSQMKTEYEALVEEYNTVAAKVAELESRAPELDKATSRIEQLLNQQSKLQRDLAARDSAIERLATKYNLVEKARVDTSADSDSDSDLGLGLLGEEHETSIGFGIKLPTDAQRGDTFLRVDMKPAKMFKWEGLSWIEIELSNKDGLVYDEDYVKFLVKQLETGESDIDELSALEQEAVSKFVKAAIAKPSTQQPVDSADEFISTADINAAK